MLEKEATQIRVGLFVFAGVILAIFVIFMLGSERNLFKSQYTLYTTFKDISGLRVGSPVQLAGLNVGFVNNISFPKDILKKDMDVELKINKKYQERIRRDSVAVINTQGLLGDKFIYINIGSESEEIVPNKGMLEGKESVGFFALAEKGKDIMENMSKAANSASRLFDDLLSEKGEIRESVRSVRNILQQAEKGKGLLHALVYDPRGSEVLNSIADSMASLKIMLGSESGSGRSRAGGILKNLEIAAKDVKEITDRVNRGEGTLGGFLTDPSIYQDVRSFLGRANRNVILKSVIRTTIEENEKNTLN